MNDDRRGSRWCSFSAPKWWASVIARGPPTPALLLSSLGAGCRVRSDLPKQGRSSLQPAKVDQSPESLGSCSPDGVSTGARKAVRFRTASRAVRGGQSLSALSALLPPYTPATPVPLRLGELLKSFLRARCEAASTLVRESRLAENLLIHGCGELKMRAST